MRIYLTRGEVAFIVRSHLSQQTGKTFRHVEVVKDSKYLMSIDTASPAFPEKDEKDAEESTQQD